MILKFKPQKYYKDIFAVDFEQLKKEGIKLVAFDLDNTLVPHDVLLAPDSIIELFTRIKKLDLDVVILSNNSKKRVAKFVGDLDIDYYFSSKKPLKKNFMRILDKYQLTNKEICLIGDQVLTDVFGAKRLNILSILVNPIAQRDIIYTKINRVFERMIIKRLEKKGVFKVGEYYE